MNRSGTWSGIALSFLLLVGCRNPTSIGRLDDPLRGGPPLPPAVALGMPAAPRGSGTPDSNGQVPPLPVRRGSTNPASLTLGHSETPGNAENATPVGVTLQPPQPLEPSESAVPNANPVPVGTTPAGSPAGSSKVASDEGQTYEGIQQALRERGVSWQHLNTTGQPDEWHFSCAVPHPDDPYLLTHYETTRVGPHGIAAMKAALDMIGKKSP